MYTEEVYRQDMLCDNARHLFNIVRRESVDAKEVLNADYVDYLSWIGFCIVFYGGGTTTFITAHETVKDWDGCPAVGLMLETVEGRRRLAKAFSNGEPTHDGCDYCLAEEVMET